MPDPSDSPTGSSPVNWSTQQLTAFLATVSAAPDERTAVRLAVERAAEALDAEVAALLRRGEVYVSIGFPSDPALERALAEVAAGRTTSLHAPGLGECAALAIEVEDDTPTSLVLARSTGELFAVDELHLARGMARVLGLSLRLFRLAGNERRHRHDAEVHSELNQRLLDSLQERQELLERLSRIQRSIAHGAGRDEVLGAISHGARELLGDELAGVLLVSADDPSMVELVSVIGRDADETRGELWPAGEGIGGRAIAEGRLVVAEDYQKDPSAITRFKDRGIEATMAAPVHEHGRIVGSLVVASYQPGRRYTAIERDMLKAFADHASLALSDSRRIEAMRERDAERIQARFRALVQNSSDMIMVVSPDAGILYVSPSVERAVELREDATLADLIHPEDRQAALAFLAEAALAGRGAAPLEWRMPARGGGWLDVETIAAGQLEHPDVQGIVLNSRDVTERKRLEAQLRQSQRLESVGQLAGGIAHDFNNFLSVIRGYARFIIDGLPDDSALRADAEEVARAAERAARLTNQLLVFSRRDVVQKRVIDLGEVLEDIRSLLRAHAERGRSSQRVDREGAAGRRGRSQPARAGPGEPGGQRPRRHAGWRAPRDRPGQRRDPRGPPRSPDGPRQRTRDGGRRAGARLRALLYDQAQGPGHGVGPCDGLRDRHPGRGQRRDRLTARRGHGGERAAARQRAAAGSG